MKKLSGIFAVSMIAIMTAGAARADIAATTYVDESLKAKQDTLKVGGADANLAGSNGIDVTIVDGKITIDGTGTAYDDKTIKADIEANKNAIAGHTTSIGENKTAIDGLKKDKEDSANKETTYNKDATDKGVKFPTVAVAEEIAKNAADAVNKDLADSIDGKVDKNQTEANKNLAVITNATGQIITGQIKTDMIEDNAVTTVKIKDANVTAAKLAADAVTTVKIKDANVTAAKLAADAVTTAKIADKNVTTEKLADNAVTTAKITDANVTTAKIADKNVTTEKLADSAVTTAKITDANVTSAKIADSAITAGKISATQLAQNTDDLSKVGNYALTLKVAEGGAQTLVWEYIGR